MFLHLAQLYHYSIMAQAMAERQNSWLPEAYTNFLETSSHLQRWRIPYRIILATSTVAAGMAFLNPEYANYLLQPQVLLTEALAYFATYPYSRIPNLNAPGRRFYKELHQQALNIFQIEGWPTKGVSKNQAISRVREVLDYTCDLAPVDNRFNYNLSPSERFRSFPKTQEELVSLSGTDRQVIRKALIFGESFWQEAPGYKAAEMVRKTRDHLAMLSNVGRQF